MNDQPRRRRIPTTKKKSRRKRPAWGLWIGTVAGVCLVGLMLWGIFRFVSNRSPATERALSAEADANAGAVDYVAQVDQAQAAGATPENNLAVIVAQIAGSDMPTPELHAEFEKRLGVSVPRTTSTALTMQERGIFHEKMGQSRYSPWGEQSYPDVVKYLESVQADLDQLIVTSAKCTHLYWPRIADRLHEGSRYSPVGSISVSHVGTLTTSIEALAVRSFMHLKNGQRAEALRDALAGLRLGNLLSQGRMSMEQVGANSRTHALRALLAILNSDQLTREELLGIEDILNSSPASPYSDTDVVNTERISMLDVTTAVATQGIEVLTPEAEGGGRSSIPRSSLTPDNIDYDEARRVVNQWVDRVQAEVAVPRPAQTRNAALLAIDAEIKALMQGPKSKAKNRTEAGARLGETVFATQSYFSPLVQSRRTYEIHCDLMILAVQMRKAALDGKSPPATLSEFLADSRPRDRFTGEELIYRAGATPQQLYIYSRGSNGVDDGAQTTVDHWIHLNDLGLIVEWNGKPI